MLTEAQKQTLLSDLRKFEGCIHHMYLDTKGNVTVGIGHLLATVEAAQRLRFLTEDGYGKPASKSQIAKEFKRLKKQKPGRVASYYARYTELFLPNAEIDQLTTEHIQQFHSELRRIYPGFDKFPWPANQALFDMAFNMGAAKLRRGWPKMNRAIESRDWREVAKESHRLGIQPARNEHTRKLFEKAAKE